MKFSLFKKIGLSFVLAAVIPVAIFFYLGSKIATEITTKEISQNNQLVSHQASNYVDLFMMNANNVLRNIGNDKDFKDGMLYDITTKLGIYGQDFVIGEEKIFESMVLLDKYGQVQTIYPFDIGYVGLDYSHYDYYQRIIAGQQNYISSDVWISPITGKPIMEMALPIKNEKGELRFILMADLSLTSITELSQKIKTGKTGYTYVLDKRGIFIAYPDKIKVSEQQNIENVFPGLFRNMGISEGNAFWPKSNPEYVISWYTLPQLGWKVVLSQGYEEAYSVSYAIKWLFFFLFAIIFLIIILVSLFVSRFIVVSPVKKLETATQKAAKGKLDIQMKLKTGDEFEELSDNFNFMIGEIRDYQEKMSAIIANFTDPIIVLDNDMKITLFNPIAEKILNLSKKNLGDKVNSPEDRFSFNDFKNIIKTKFEVKEIECDENKKPIIEEVTIENKNNTDELVYKVMTANICTKKNKCYGRMKIFYDQTREKNIEKLKTEFVSLAAHQLRTPLSAIKWVFEMILGGDVGNITQEQKNFLEKGYHSNKRMIALVDDLLNVAKIESGRFLYNFTYVSLEEMVEKTISMFDRRLDDNKTKIRFKKSKEPLPDLKIDAEKIKFVISNLIDNSINYSFQGGEIDVAIMLDNNNIRVEITDTGIGIPDNQKKRIFSKFFRASNAVTKETDGNGLGLYICKNIVETHGGKIGFESEKDKGSIFWFTLPIN